MAVIKTASGEAPRSGLYAIRSMVTPSSVQTMTDASTPSTGGMPRVLITVKAENAPTIIISPWAKFSILAIPYTIV